jgi:hypothetical protein
MLSSVQTDRYFIVVFLVRILLKILIRKVGLLQEKEHLAKGEGALLID